MTSESRAATKAAYRAKHRARANAYSKAWYAQKPEVINSRTKKAERRILQAAYKALIREYVAEIPHRKRLTPTERERRRQLRERVRNQRKTARQRAKVSGRLKAGDLLSLFDLQKGKCFYCCKRLPKDYHVDHFVPLSRGGTNERSNLRLACPRCNSAKAAKLPEEFLGLLVA